MLYLDLDGVFADFESKALELLAREGLSLQDDKDKVWGCLEKYPNLFLSLSPMPGYQKLFRTIKGMYPECQILTALPLPTGNLTSAARDKVAWVRKHLDKNIQVNCTLGWESKKYFYAYPGDFLIDDTFRNIVDWPGHAIHHVCPEKTVTALFNLLAI